MKEFISGLFDFRFNRFITPAVAGILMIILYVLATLGWLGFLFGENYYIPFFKRFLITVIGYPLTIIGIRLWIEMMVALTKIANNMSEIIEVLKNKNS